MKQINLMVIKMESNIQQQTSRYDKVDPEEIIRLLREIIDRLNSERTVENG